MKAIDIGKKRESLDISGLKQIWAYNLSRVLKDGNENHQTLPYINKILKCT